MSKKLIIAAIAAVLAFGATIAEATPSRIETLGQPMSGMYLMDDTNIFWNPATAAYYRKAVLIHLGASDGGDMYAYGGVTLGMGDMITLGIVAGRNPDYESGVIGMLATDGMVVSSSGLSPTGYIFNDVWAADWNGLAVDSVGWNDEAMDWMNPLDLMLALSFGNVNLGVSWYYANGKTVATNEASNPGPVADDEVTIKASLHSVKVGLSADLGNMMPELWFHYDPFKVTGEWEDNLGLGASFERELKGRRINLGARAFVKLSDSLTLVPAVEWVSGRGDVSLDGEAAGFPFTAMVDTLNYGYVNLDDLSEEYKMNGVGAGLGINYTADRILVASSIGLNWSKAERSLEIDGINQEQTDTQKYLAVPVVSLGVEYQATKILILRAGVQTTTLYAKSTELSEWEDNTNVAAPFESEDEVKMTTQSTFAAAGMGLAFGNLLVDLTLGGASITGEEDPNALFSALDVKYRFE